MAIARALVHEPSLLVCDEPTAALDHETGLTVMELLREAAVRPDRAVVVVTHDNRVFHFGDRIAHMDDGRIVEVEDTDRRRGRLSRSIGRPIVPDPSIRRKVDRSMFTKYVLPLLAVAGRGVRGLHGRPGAAAAAAVAADRRAADRGPTTVTIDRRRGAGRGQAGEHPDRRRTSRAWSGEVFVKIGDKVKKGDPLFRIDDRDLQAAAQGPRGGARGVARPSSTS